MTEPIPIEQARQLVLSRAQPLEPERVPLAQASGRVLAEAAVAAVDLPPFPSSAMDGFAVRAADVPGVLRIAARIAAGRPATQALQAGEAMEISTGGVVPEGADAVVPIEAVVGHDNYSVEIPSDVAVGANVRQRAGDVPSGAVVVSRGTLLGPAQLGALAAAGVASVACARRPRAIVLTTGTELRAPGEPLGPGEVYEANSVIIAAQLEASGAEAERLAPVVDDEDAHRDAIARGLQSDVFVTTGGVSVGPHDLVRRIESELGVEEVFWRVAVRPGKPVAFGVRGSTLVFGLPGNPVSSLVGFELFVRPAIHALQGMADPGPRFLPGRLACDLRRNPARDDLVRARTQSEGTEVVLEPLSGQDSHMIVRSASADALVLIPRGDGVVAAGEPVRYLPLD